MFSELSLAERAFLKHAAQHAAAPERIKVIHERQRLSASGELCRYAASFLGKVAAESYLWGKQNQMLLS